MRDIRIVVKRMIEVANNPAMAARLESVLRSVEYTAKESMVIRWREVDSIFKAEWRDTPEMHAAGRIFAAIDS